MTTQEALLAAIIADPDDDLPRLAYADWLEEVGQIDHAMYIRDNLAHPNRVTHNAPRWRSHPFFELVGFVAVRSRRGFVEYVSCPLRKWLKYGRQVVRLHPITAVHINDCTPTVESPLEDWSSVLWVFDTSLSSYFHSFSPDIVAHLTHSPSHDGRIRYADYDSALADMGQACLKWAKQKARREAAT